MKFWEAFFSRGLERLSVFFKETCSCWMQTRAFKAFKKFIQLLKDASKSIQKYSEFSSFSYDLNSF